MKVLLAILKARVARGGAERYTRDLVVALAGRGLEVTTAAEEFDEDWPGGRVALEVTGLLRSARYGSYLASLSGLLSQRRFDVVHAMLPVRRCDFYHPHAGVAAMTKRTGPFELGNLRRRRMARTERELLTGDRPPVTIALSGYVLNQLRGIYPTAPAEVLLNGVDTARFDPLAAKGMRAELRQRWGVGPDEVALLCIAQDFERKGVPVAVEAVGRLRDLPVTLIVVGRDDPVPIVKLAAGLGVSDRVVLAGPVGDTRAAYAAGDLFVLPTRHDPCSLVVIEALAMGLPVISTRFNGSCEWMTDGVHGSVLSDVDAGQVERAVRRWWNPAERSGASAACLLLRPRLDQAAHVDRLIALYRHRARGTAGK